MSAMLPDILKPRIYGLIGDLSVYLEAKIEADEEQRRVAAELAQWCEAAHSNRLN